MLDRVNRDLTLPFKALSSSARSTLEEIAAAPGDVRSRSSSGAKTLTASHYAGIYAQRAKRHRDVVISKVLQEVASNLGDFAETGIALFLLEDQRNWYTLFLNTEGHAAAGFFCRKPSEHAPKVVRELVRGITRLERIVERSVEEWAPEPIPTTVVLGDVARAFVEDATPALTTLIFERVEAVLHDGTSSEKDAIGTGFLEGVVSAVDRDPAARWVLGEAGPAATAYIDAWNRFCGVPV